jgi:DNA-binding beta-propeller fold protein YncE
MSSRTSCLGLCLAFAGCVTNEGVDPPGDRIFYPTGMAVDPVEGRFLFVASSNFDIAYNGGTVVTIDLALVEDRARSDPGAEVDESELLVPGSAVEIGTFANEVVASPDGTRIYVSVRGDHSVTLMDVDASGRLTCSASQSGSVPECSGGWVLGRQANDRGLALPDEPTGLALDTVGDRLFVAHADEGEVSMFEHVSGSPELTSVQNDFPPGATGIAIRKDAAGAFLDAYVTSRTEPVITRFGVIGDVGVEIEHTTSVDFLGVGGVDQRGIAFSSDFSTAYVVSRFPESLLFLDTTPNAVGTPADDFIDAVEVEEGPAVLAVGPPGGPEPARGLVYVSCFRARKVFVIDPVLREIVDVILTGEGPHTMVFDPVRPLAYLAQFTESTIAVLDVDRTSPTFHQRLLTIGIPDPPAAAR